MLYLNFSHHGFLLSSFFLPSTYDNSTYLHPPYSLRHPLRYFSTPSLLLKLKARHFFIVHHRIHIFNQHYSHHHFILLRIFQTIHFLFYHSDPQSSLHVYYKSIPFIFIFFLIAFHITFLYFTSHLYHPLITSQQY